ncbi:snake venom metalloproteinase atrolysin-C-like [Rana temporaria]|uniref:snake venom metalloproteinase atrolysin-C-like n=1 Tax=Rana temporaria TaxID=8407 RepID=UPI001AACC2FC|nr:snake venom metalloproteinase atrolysin-C-like [Rana temporaria]
MLISIMSPLVMFILPVIVPGLHALPTGHKYKVVIPQQIHALYKSDTQDQYPHVVKYELQIEDKPLVIHLERNEELVADRYMETSYDQDDRPIMISPKGNIKVKSYSFLMMRGQLIFLCR